MSPRRPLTLPSLRNYVHMKHPNRPLSTPPRQAPQPRDARSRIRRLNNSLPRFLRGYTTPLLEAPVTHATSFLILHELTAIAPLFGLVAAFHYGGWMPDFRSGASVSAFDDAVARFGRWLRKKGWVDDVDYGGSVDSSDGAGPGERIQGGEGKTARLALEFASAYVITKALLPVRIAVSVWATPWFARIVLGPASKWARRLLRR